MNIVSYLITNREFYGLYLGKKNPITNPQNAENPCNPKTQEPQQQNIFNFNSIMKARGFNWSQLTKFSY